MEYSGTTTAKARVYNSVVNTSLPGAEPFSMSLRPFDASVSSMTVLHIDFLRYLLILVAQQHLGLKHQECMRVLCSVGLYLTYTVLFSSSLVLLIRLFGLLSLVCLLLQLM